MHDAVQSQNRERYGVNFDPDKSSEYFPSLCDHFTRNSVFGAKVFFHSVRSHPRLLDVFDNGYFVHLVRRNLEAQVVSLAALMLTGRPLNNEARIGPTLKKPLDEKKLRFLCEFVVNSDANWRRFLRGQRVLTLYTEDLTKDPQRFARNLFEFTGRDDFSSDYFYNFVSAQKRYSVDRDVKSDIQCEFREVLREFGERHAGRTFDFQT